MKISVIIPVFNREKYIADALDSVLNQKINGHDIEVIVVDDGSTDNTKLAIKPYLNRIQFIEIPHSGLPAAPRNAGILKATGDIIAFQDSDDLWVKDKLSIQLPTFNDPKIVMTYGNAETIDKFGNKTDNKVIVEKELTNGESFKNLLKQNVISTLTVMVRKEALIKAGLFNESQSLRAVEDYELWLRIAALNPKGIKSIPSTLAYYRTHGQNISTSDDMTAIEKLLNVYDALWESKLMSNQRKILETQISVMQENWSRLSNELKPETRPKVSVVMSLLNAEKFLRPAVDSILNQTFKNFEFIIINDGSTDSTMKILNSYNDPRIRIIQQQNHGLVYSLNKAISISRAPFIARQDADDISLPARLKKELALIEKNSNIGVVGTYFTYIDEDGNALDVTITAPTKSIDIKRSMYFTNPFGHGTVMLRKSIFGNVDNYTNDYGPTEDFELWHRVGDKWEFGMVPESLYRYRINPNSISHTNGDIQHKFTAKIIAEQWAKPLFFKNSMQIISDGKYYRNMRSLYKDSVYNEYVARQIDIANVLFNKGVMKSAIRTAWGAVYLKPKCWHFFVKPGLKGIIRSVKNRIKL